MWASLAAMRRPDRALILALLALNLIVIGLGVVALVQTGGLILDLLR